MPNSDKIVSLIPLEEIEQGALKQIYDNVNIPMVKKIAIMPDCHQGYTICIGAVMLVEDHISSSAVGYDIGCGMTFLNTNENVESFFESYEDKVNLFNDILKIIPVGFNQNEDGTIYHKDFKSASGNKNLDKLVNEKLGKQFGTLGQGNHFYSIDFNRENKFCITIHSGSRRPGWEVGNYYMNLAKQEGAYNQFFKLDSELGQSYLKDMSFMLQYALDNRLRMLEKVCKMLGVKVKDYINENHNHAIVTKDGILHRKGATPADEGQLGVIPISMRDGVYITKGLGNKKYLSSASHGAGRRMSRGFAKKNIDINRFKNQMEGIIAKVDESFLDEAPDAYKDADYVINAQRGIVVDIIVHAMTLIVIIG
jgi:tRNA-splicing ligase RtcB